MQRTSIILLVVSVVTPSVDAQTPSSVNLIESQVDSLRVSLLKWGPLYVTPGINLSTGYDSNPLSTTDPTSDVTAVIGPSVHIAAPIGKVAFFELDEALSYVYYREQVDLRRFWNNTSVSGGFGGRRFLVRLGGGVRDETARPTTEFDFPVRQQTSNIASSLTLALGWRQQLELAYLRSAYEIVEGVDDPTVSQRLDRVEDRGSLTFSRRLTAKTSAVAEGIYDTFAFSDATRDGESYGARFGFEFSPSGGDPMVTPPLVGSFLNGRFLLGFRSVAPFDPARVDYVGLIGSADVSFGFGEGQRLQVLYARDIVPSIFDENWYFVENRVGATFTYQMTQRLSLSPGFTVGRNLYPLPGETVDEEGNVTFEEIFDHHTVYRLGISVRITRKWSVGVNADYNQRNSNVVEFTKDRLQIGFTTGFSP